MFLIDGIPTRDERIAARAKELRRCPKCGGSVSRVVFSKGCDGGGHLSRDSKPCEVRRDHLHLYCSCTYDWTTWCLDAE